MSQKDYVSRGRSQKPAPPVERPQLPWLRIVITLGLVAAFAFGLYSIKDRAEQAPVTPAPQATINEDPLPEMPEEEWEFIKSLPEYQVEIEEREQQVSDKRYIMQCGSFRSESQAMEMEAKIGFQGLAAQVRPSDGSNGRWYRVILGPYTSKRDAEKHRHLLRRNNITTCKIW